MSLLCLAALLSAFPDPADVQVRPGKDPTRVEVVARFPGGLPAELASGKISQEQGERWLRLALVHPKTGRPGPALFGSYEPGKGTLVFRPRHPLTHKLSYQ